MKRPFFYAGLLVAAWAASHSHAPDLPASVPTDRPVAVAGRVVAPAETRDLTYGGTRTDLLLDVRRVWTGRTGEGLPVSSRLRVVWEDAPAVYPGDEWVLAGQIRPFSPPRNPGSFDERAYWAIRSCAASLHVGSADDHHLLKRGRGSLASWAHRVRKGLSRRLMEDFPGREGAFLAALFLGERTDLDQDFRDLFLNTGTSHILAVSGFNVAFLGAVLWFMIRWLPIPRPVRCAIVLSGIWVYALIVGDQAPVLRASIMASIVLVGGILGRKSDGLNALGLAAVILLLLKPIQILDLGFQLSFLAVLALVVCGPLWSRSGSHPARRWISELFWSTFICYFVTLPLVIQQFYIVTPYVFLANFIVVPLSFLLYGALIPYLLLPHIPLAAPFIHGILWTLTHALFTVESLPGSVLIVGRLIAPLWAVLAAGIAAALCMAPKRRLVRAGAMLLFVAGVIMAQDLYRLAVRRTEWTMLDVGQGDALHAQFRKGGDILIDGGSARFSDQGRWTIVPYLRSKGIRRLDAVFISHPQEDHIGGLRSVIENIPVARVYTSGAEADSAVWRDLKSLLEERRIPLIPLNRGSVVESLSSARIEVLHPPEDVNAETDLNDRSLVLRVESGGYTALLTGDIEEEAMRSILTSGQTLKTDLLKVPHHGSRVGSAGRQLFALARPSRSWISAGRRNPFGHPAEETLRSLAAIPGNVVDVTARQGALSVRLDAERRIGLSSSNEP